MEKELWPGQVPDSAGAGAWNFCFAYQLWLPRYVIRWVVSCLPSMLRGGILASLHQ